MLRGENIVCGTTTTGTGTLTLAAAPAAIGAVDFNAWLKATGVGFVSGNAILVSYTIIEYTDSTFAKPKFVEKGIGTLTLGAALVNATLARTIVQTVSDANAGAYQVGAGATAITIGTAANTLVFVGASASDLQAYPPYFSTANDGGAVPAGVYAASTGNLTLTSGTEIFSFFEWKVPMLVKRASLKVGVAYATGTPVSNATARIYALDANCNPGKLLYDFGLLGTVNASLNAVGTISSAATGNGFFLHPGEYAFSFSPVFSGATTAPAIVTSGTVVLSSGRYSSSALIPRTGASSTSGTAGAAPDPANLTGYTLLAGSTALVLFSLKPN